MKKHWIYLKRGLSEDPKHREAMGMAVWLFMHICDAADWEKGIVYDWRDKEIAIDMSISTNTVREWRSRLAEKKYITCKQRQHGIDIIIHNWINPRDYGGKKMNIFQGDASNSPSDKEKFQDLPQGESQGESQVPSLSNTNPAPFIESESESESEPEIGDAEIFTKLSELTGGGLSSNTPKFVDAWLERHTPARILEAIQIAKEKKGRSTNYVDAILTGWDIDGYPKTREERAAERKAKQPMSAYQQIQKILSEQRSKQDVNV